MKSFSQLIVHLADLAEAEGRALRTAVRAEFSGFRTGVRAEMRELRGHVSRIGFALVFLLAGFLLLVCGLAMAARGLVILLVPYWGPGGATLGVGVFVLILAGVSLWMFQAATARAR